MSITGPLHPFTGPLGKIQALYISALSASTVSLLHDTHAQTLVAKQHAAFCSCECGLGIQTAGVTDYVRSKSIIRRTDAAITREPVYRGNCLITLVTAKVTQGGNPRHLDSERLKNGLWPELFLI